MWLEELVLSGWRQYRAYSNLDTDDHQKLLNRDRLAAMQTRMEKNKSIVPTLQRRSKTHCVPQCLTRSSYSMASADPVKGDGIKNNSLRSRGRPNKYTVSMEIFLSGIVKT
jgi:hypothetical protein